MVFYVVEPEASGSPGADRVASGEPVCTFDTWLGDDMVRAHPLLLVTTGLKDALLAMRKPTGFSLVRAQASPSPFFERHAPDRRLPPFWSVLVDGRPGLDDLGLGRDGSIVASARVVSALGRFSMKHATLSQYSVAEVEEGDKPLISR